jgi:RNA polymerase sigma-70 factor (ECF subfamily)
MNTSEDSNLQLAITGDINAFQALFAAFQQQLKSYLYRLVADRNDAEDLAHDTFIKAFSNIKSFRGDASLKTWVFRIATNLAYDHLKQWHRWPVTVKTQAKDLCMNTPAVLNKVMEASRAAGENDFEIRNHIDMCFTCMGKTLVIEKQVVLILKDVYDFPIKEIALIIEKTADVVKHLLQDAREIMTDIFESRCALINKNGVCHQCSELNGMFNPKQNLQEELNKLELTKDSKKYNRDQLYELRTLLVKTIDPLRIKGADLLEVLMKCDRMVMGEIPIPS